jgi:hypothetical protein
VLVHCRQQIQQMTSFSCPWLRSKRTNPKPTKCIKYLTHYIRQYFLHKLGYTFSRCLRLTRFWIPSPAHLQRWSLCDAVKQNKNSHPSLVIYFLFSPTPPIKLELEELQIGGETLIANHLDKSVWMVNQR